MKNPKAGERCRKRYESGTFIDGDILEVHGDGVTVQWDRDKVKCPTYKTKHHRTHLIRLKPKMKNVIEFETDWLPDFKPMLDSSITQQLVSIPHEEAIKFCGKRCKVTVEVLE